MNRAQSTKLGLFLTLIGFVLGGFALWQGAFYLTHHEGDTLHVSEIVFRMAAGEVPHLDFMTPIGGLAFAPFASFVEGGMGLGRSILWSQAGAALLLTPIAWWVAVSRLNFVNGLLFGALIPVLCLAVIHGKVETGLSISMHYNRWCWALSFLVIMLSVFESRRRSDLFDGVLIGALMTGLVMIKVTYFAAFAPVVLLALVLRSAWRSLAAALGTGLVIAAGLTLWLGADYWFAYLGDLLEVSQSDLRSEPGLPLLGIVTDPEYRGAWLAAVVAVIFLRQSGRQREGLLLLVLLPAFIYVTYQNFGNDPQWLLLLAVMLIALRPEPGMTNGFGWDMRQASHILIAVVLAFGLPSYLNMAYSPVTMANQDPDEYEPLFLEDNVHADLQLIRVRTLRADAKIALDTEGMPLASRADPEERDDPTVFQGETLPFCTVDNGIPIYMEEIAEDLTEAGFGASRIFFADLFSSIWLYGDFERLEGGSPWYYSGLPGWESADYLLVPLCVIYSDVRTKTLENIEAAREGEEPLRELRRTELYVLYDAP
ncbi:glycosyltransferase family 87 protein [Aestuariibius insulae]|uniref:glycosyltransferase family 87 protein n=1 Tax=Aestuariibius insulae TaxID=2058287 RepID=UPI00345E18D7